MNVPDTAITTMVMQFGQFLDHDLTLTPETEEECCHREEDRAFSKLHCFKFRFSAWNQKLSHDTIYQYKFLDNQPACLPIGLPCDENHFNQMSRMTNPIKELSSKSLSMREEEGEVEHCDPEALDFVRSIPFCGLSFFIRDQMNVVTAYCDASNVYGSMPDLATALRTNSYGTLKTSGR